MKFISGGLPSRVFRIPPHLRTQAHTCLLKVASVMWSHACSGNFSSCPEGSCHGNRQPLLYLRMVPSVSCATAVWVSGLAMRQSKGPGERVVQLGGGRRGKVGREGRKEGRGEK